MPAPYKFGLDMTDDSAGIVRVADNAWIPNNPALGPWREYEAWKAEPNTPDPGTATTLPQRRITTKQKVDLQLERELQKTLPIFRGASALSGFMLARLIAEAIAVEGDGSPTAANYPNLDAQVGIHGASIADVGTYWRGWWASVRADAAEVYAVAEQAKVDINAAASLAAIDAVLAGLTWPS